MSYDESIDGPDERLEDRAYIAALSAENDDQTRLWESRMDVHDSEISYLGNEGDFHNDVSELGSRTRTDESWRLGAPTHVAKLVHSRDASSRNRSPPAVLRLMVSLPTLYVTLRTRLPAHVAIDQMHERDRI